MQCSTINCQAQAEYRYLWPGKRWSTACGTHARYAVHIASVMGFSLHLDPVESKSKMEPLDEVPMENRWVVCREGDTVDIAKITTPLHAKEAINLAVWLALVCDIEDHEWAFLMAEARKIRNRA